MNSVFKTYSSVYNVALMHHPKSEGDAAIAKTRVHGHRPSLFDRLFGR